ncbi:MAG: hypothetical protein RDU14_16815 [Melioribacteraceae bacterium]|nr:hypothetical protein [Melioribacteraceae bacterium]
MNLLLDYDNVVIYAGTCSLVAENGGVMAKIGTKEICFYPNLNQTNSTIVENVNNVPAQVTGRYCYVDGQFVRNPQYREQTEDSMFGVFQMLDPNIPKTGDVGGRLEKLVALILELASHPEKLFDISPELIEGLNLRNENISSLSGSKLTNYKLGQNYLNKMRTRLLIDQQVGDVYDQIADLDKQIQLTYTLNLRAYMLVMDLYKQLTFTIPADILPAEIKTSYEALGNMFLALIKSGQYRDRTDIEDAGTIAQALIPKKIAIADIVKPEYLDKYYIV